VLFDLDGTLFDRDASFLELVQAQYHEFLAELAAVPKEVFVRRVIELDEHGFADKAEVYRDIATEFSLPQSLATRLTGHFYGTYASFSKCFPEVPGTLAHLRTLGLQLGIITNGSTNMQERKVNELGIAGLMDELLISEKEGLRKPDPRIFARALGRLGLSSDEAWYVGDHPTVDIRGAFNAGLTAVWRYTPYWHRPDVPCLAINSIDELMQMLPEPGV
jgi:putative hydrolase of the HAD superfamily